uniref:CARD domain-containing protein n=1 Tax=Plectus sambesii TaxID=2011161 RepID=A0A914VKG2_9BILA
MDELKQKAIKHHYANLIKCMNALWIMDHIAHLLSLEEMELIRMPLFTSQERTRELIAILLRKNEELRPFDYFIEALEETDENHKTMAEAILNTYENNNVTVLAKIPRTSFPDAENTEHDLQIVQQSLKQMYMARFQKVYPFSLPFTFDIEKTWVSLAMKEYNKELDAAGYFTHRSQRPLRALEDDKKDSVATEDHAELLTKAFGKVKMLIIEGDPATGKTSLMRRDTIVSDIHLPGA